MAPPSEELDLRHTTATDGALAIETKGLTKAFGSRVVVDDLTFQIPKGCVAAFVGPNGAGKTTTIRMLLGLVYPTSGSARVLGGTLNHPESYLPRVGALIEGPAFYPPLSGRANLEVLRSLGQLKTENVDQVLELVGLDKRSNDRVSRYSLGMKQRLGVAAALLPEPELLVLDEPANGLDPTGIAAMRKLLRNVADEGITVLVSSHQLSEVQQVADWVILINQGRLKYQGRLAQLLEKSGTIFVSPERATDVERLARALRNAGYEPVTVGPGRLMVKTDESPSKMNRLAMEMGIMLSELHAQSSLERVYFAMTDGGSIA